MVLGVGTWSGMQKTSIPFLALTLTSVWFRAIYLAGDFAGGEDANLNFVSSGHLFLRGMSSVHLYTETLYLSWGMLMTGFMGPQNTEGA